MRMGHKKREDFGNNTTVWTKTFCVFGVLAVAEAQLQAWNKGSGYCLVSVSKIDEC